MSETNNSNIEYAEADSQEEAAEQLMQDLDEENGSWSPLFPTEPGNEEYDPWLPQFETPNHEEILAGIPYETIGQYLGRSARRNMAERVIEHQGFLNIQADFVEEVSQRLEVERKANFQQRQIAVLERQNQELRHLSAEMEEQSERQLEYFNRSEEKCRQEAEVTKNRIVQLEFQVREGFQKSIYLEEQNSRQLDYLNATIQRHCQEMEQKDAKIRELESRKTEIGKLKRWAKSRARRAKGRVITKTL